MDYTDIKIECEKMYAQISEAENRLKFLRANCKHLKTFEGNYSWRIGAIQRAEICSDCGSLIKYLDATLPTIDTTQSKK